MNPFPFLAAFLSCFELAAPRRQEAISYRQRIASTRRDQETALLAATEQIRPRK